MATPAQKNPVKKAEPRKINPKFVWEAVDAKKRVLKGEMSGKDKAAVEAALKKQGLKPIKVKKPRGSGSKAITGEDIAVFTRQLSTMLKSGVPLLQAFDIVAGGHNNLRMQALLLNIKEDVESGVSLSGAFKRHPVYFNDLYCNLIEAGEQAGILEGLLDRLATYQEKTLSIKKKIKGALFYPTAVIAVAFIITAVLMIWVVPVFASMFDSFGGDLPGPTKFVMHLSEIFVAYWWLIFGSVGGLVYTFRQLKLRSTKFQDFLDRVSLKFPIFGNVIEKATIARWARTLATMFAAGVPLVDALESVGGAAGNVVYRDATKKIRSDVQSGLSLTASIQNQQLFPSMLLQMSAIGEESGSLDSMLGKVADFYEEEVDNAVANISSLMEPFIMVILGTLIGGLVIAMYLPIFKMGSVAG